MENENCFIDHFSAIDNDGDGQKCAEIYFLNEKLIFHCNFCLNEKFFEYFQLKMHLFSIHLSQNNNVLKIQKQIEIVSQQNEDNKKLERVAHGNLTNNVEPYFTINKNSPKKDKFISDSKVDVFDNQLHDKQIKESESIEEQGIEPLFDKKLKIDSIVDLKIDNKGIRIEKKCRKKKLMLNLNRIYTTLEIDGVTRFRCESCEKHFNSKENLRSHERIHRIDDFQPCKYCGKLFKNRYLQNHVVTHSDEKPLKCKICNKGFKTKSGLSVHRAVHKDEKPYKCNLCNVKFKSKNGYKNHKLVHTGEKPFVCEICAQAFKSLNSLKDHKLSHSERVELFFCDICNRGFVKKPCLMRHMKTVHSDVKKFVCNTCGAAYKEKKGLNQHQKIHQGTNEYSCKICGLEFVRYSRVRDHIISQHKESAKNIRNNVIYSPVDGVSTNNINIEESKFTREIPINESLINI